MINIHAEQMGQTFGCDMSNCNLNCQDTLKIIRKQPCFACGHPGPSDADHIKTRGAGGKEYLNARGSLVLNVWPLCRVCHTLRHNTPLRAFCEARPHLMKHLEFINHPIIYRW